jgi:preprotein translocase subunit YajC
VQVVKAAIGRVIPEEDAAEETAVTTDEVDAEAVAKDPVDVPGAGTTDGKVQDAPKLPPTHTEN